MAEISAGSIVDDRFEIVSPLGEGGMGSVYKAIHREMQRTVALKLLKASLVTHTDALSRFRREAQVISALDHPNIVSVYSVGAGTDGVPYIAMEFLQGQTLAQTIKRDGALAWREALPLFMQICDGLSQAHRKGIIHRDLKPGNLVIERKDETVTVKIVDFGISKILSAEQGLTKTSAVIGSVLYMSPEQATGGVPTGSSDIYSLGCTLFEALVGRPPFGGDSVAETAMQHQQAVAPALSSLVANLPTALDRVMWCCLEKDPLRRYQTADALKEDLDNVLHARPLQNVPDGQGSSSDNSRFRFVRGTRGGSTLRQYLLPLAVLCVVAVFGVGAYSTLYEKSKRTPGASETDDAPQRAHAELLLTKVYDLVDRGKLAEAEAALQEADDYAKPLQDPYLDGNRLWSRARIQFRQAQLLQQGTKGRRDLVKKAEENYVTAYDYIDRARATALADGERLRLKKAEDLEMLYFHDAYELLAKTRNPRPLPTLSRELADFIVARGTKLSKEERSFFDGMTAQAIEECVRAKDKRVAKLVMARARACRQQGYARSQIDEEISRDANAVQAFNPDSAEAIRSLLLN
ncbi:MAG: serine/threonine-protein kinase [Candidatus Obscuribacterales bacterium]